MARISSLVGLVVAPAGMESAAQRLARIAFDPSAFACADFA
jgi:hypothetical protein